jgi:PncC family amidohydrolase
MELDQIKRLQHTFIEKKKKLALAESCTGGKMASLITSISGSSAYFLGSLVVYSDKMKQDLLKVPEKLLKEKGAVSKEVVEAMLAGLFQVTVADFGIAVSGIAGPTGGTLDKPVGTIWAALGERGKAPKLLSFRAQGGNRLEIIHSTCSHLFGELQKLLS